MFHLRYFVAVAEELNFSKAAQRLHMAAPPLSQRIKDLERELDTKLLDRDTHGVALTAAGATLLPLARDVIERFNALAWRTKAAANPDRAQLIAGVPPLLHPALREVLTAVQERLADTVDLRLWPGPSAALVEAVHDGRLACCLARTPVSRQDLATADVRTERLGAAVPANRFPSHTEVRLAELTDLAFTAGPESLSNVFLRQLDAGLAAAGIHRRLPATPTDVSGISELIAGGMAFSIATLDPDSAIQQFDAPGVRILPFADFDAVLTTALVWRADRVDSDPNTAETVSVARELLGG